MIQQNLKNNDSRHTIQINELSMNIVNLQSEISELKNENSLLKKSNLSLVSKQRKASAVLSHKLYSNFVTDKVSNAFLTLYKNKETFKCDELTKQLKDFDQRIKLLTDQNNKMANEKSLMQLRIRDLEASLEKPIVFGKTEETQTSLSEVTEDKIEDKPEDKAEAKVEVSDQKDISITHIDLEETKKDGETISDSLKSKTIEPLQIEEKLKTAVAEVVEQTSKKQKKKNKNKQKWRNI